MKYEIFKFLLLLFFSYQSISNAQNKVNTDDNVTNQLQFARSVYYKNYYNKKETNDYCSQKVNQKKSQSFR